MATLIDYINRIFNFFINVGYNIFYFVYDLLLLIKKYINYILVALVSLVAIYWTISQLQTNQADFTRKLILAFLNGLAFSMILFLMVSGFYLIFGLADVINFAHGAFFMLGGFVGYVSYTFWESLFIDYGLFNANKFNYSILSFILAIISTAVIMGIIGAIVEFSTIRPLYKKPLNQILLTVGLSFIIIQIVQLDWGQKTYQIPKDTTSKYFFVSGNLGKIGLYFSNLNLNITFFDFSNLGFEFYSLIIIFLGLILAVIMYFTITRTKLGLLVQASIEDAEMSEILGTNVKLLLSLVFIVGISLAGIAGFLLVPSTHGGANISNATTYLLYAFVIVVVGGAHYGKFEGTFFGSLIIGFSYKFTEQFFLDYTTFIVFVIMALVLIFKPTGLTGQEE